MSDISDMDDLSFQELVERLLTELDQMAQITGGSSVGSLWGRSASVIRRLKRREAFLQESLTNFVSRFESKP